MPASASPLIRFLRFLGKVQFTLVLLIGGALIMTVGTIVESRESREAAWSLIYGAIWFDFFLLLIAVNLVVAVVNRIPIQRHQWAFVLTHFSIVLLLTGSWISRNFGYEGRMPIYEGSEESRIFLDSYEIRTRWSAAPDDSSSAPPPPLVVEATFPFRRASSLVGRTLQEEIDGRPGLRVAEYVRDGVATVTLGRGGAEHAPGIEFLVTGAGLDSRLWLIARDEEFARRDIGPLEIEFVDARSGEPPQSSLASPDGPLAVLVVPRVDGGDPVRIPLPESLGAEIPCGPGVVARVQKLFLRGRLIGGELVEVATAKVNPAAVVEIQSGDRSEIHTVFRDFPDFDSVHGRGNADALVGQLQLEVLSEGPKPRATILLDSDSQLRLALRTWREPEVGPPFRAGDSVALGDLALRLKVERLLPGAVPRVAVRPSPRGQETEQAYLRLEATLDGTSDFRWLRRGSEIDWILDGGRLEASYVPRTRSVPFTIALDDFQVLNYPGSRRPSEYRSIVRIRTQGPDTGERDAVVSMNRPLDLAGFRLFQSSYQLGEGGGPDVTILTVSYDPGVPVVYFSFLLIILGIAWYVKGAGRRQIQPIPEPQTPAREKRIPSA